MKEKIYTRERMRAELTNGLNDAARKLETLQEVTARNLPGSVWCDNFVWALAQYPDLKYYFRERILKDTATRMGLNYEFGAILVSEDVKLNRKLVEIDARPAIETISEFVAYLDVHKYLRIGAIHIADNGAVKIASDAVERIEAFCSVYAESTAEKAFIGRLTAMQETAARLEKLHGEFLNAIDVPGGQAAAQTCKRYYTADLFYLAQGLRLNAPNMIWRAFVGFCANGRKKDAPHFYNKVGIPEIDVPELYKLTGYKPAATPELRVKFPKLYKDEPYRMFIGSTIYDDAQGVEYVEELIKERGYSIDHRGNLVFPTNRKFGFLALPYAEDVE